jgi:branched-chain amino acid transport system permease protein
VAAFGFAALLMAVLPWLVGPFRVVQLTAFLIYGMLALSLDLIWGVAGILSFGQAALFGIGGYVYGIVAINTGLPLLGLVAGIATAAGVAAVLGYVSFYGRVAPMFFAVITLILALILYQVMGSTADPRYAVGAARLGGYNGMTMVPTPGGEVPFLSGAPLTPSGLLYLVGGLLLGVLAFCIMLARSSFGRILQGIRENEQRAELLGFDIRWRKTAIFTIAGAIAGLAGGLFAAWGNFINPEVFSLPQAALVVIWVLVGGRGTLYGAILGAVAVQALSSYLGAAGSAYTTLLLGTALLAIVLFFKEGLAPALWWPIRRAVLNRTPSPDS